MCPASPSETGNTNHGHTKPRTFSAAQEFNHLIQERVGKLKSTLPPEHYALYDTLNGKHPRDMARIIADAFATFYSVVPNIQLRVLNHLYPEHYKKQPISFVGLNRRMASLEDQFHEDSPCLDLVESLREIFKILSKPKRDDLAKRINKYGEDATFSPKQIEQQWHDCRHCWRRVYRYPSENGVLLCEEHHRESTGKGYRQRERIHKKFKRLWFEWQAGGNYLFREMKNQAGSEVMGEQYALALCFVLPHVREYLLDRLPDEFKNGDEAKLNELHEFLDKPKESPFWSLPFEQHEEYMRTHKAPGADLIRAVVDVLDPPPSKTDTNLAKARELFVERLTWNFAEYIDCLYRAEAWMEAEELSRHGGKREKIADMRN